MANPSLIAIAVIHASGGLADGGASVAVMAVASRPHPPPAPSRRCAHAASARCGCTSVGGAPATARLETRRRWAGVASRWLQSRRVRSRSSSVRTRSTLCGRLGRDRSKLRRRSTRGSMTSASSPMLAMAAALDSLHERRCDQARSLPSMAVLGCRSRCCRTAKASMPLR